MINSYSDAKAMQPTTESTTTIDFDISDNNDFQPQENQPPEDIIAQPIHKPSTTPTNLLKPIDRNCDVLPIEYDL
jgi:hypothetical protein